MLCLILCVGLRVLGHSKIEEAPRALQDTSLSWVWRADTDSMARYMSTRGLEAKAGSINGAAPSRKQPESAHQYCKVLGLIPFLLCLGFPCDRVFCRFDMSHSPRVCLRLTPLPAIFFKLSQSLTATRPCFTINLAPADFLVLDRCDETKTHIQACIHAPGALFFPACTSSTVIYTLHFLQAALIRASFFLILSFSTLSYLPFPNCLTCRAAPGGTPPAPDEICGR